MPPVRARRGRKTGVIYPPKNPWAAQRLQPREEPITGGERMLREVQADIADIYMASEDIQMAKIAEGIKILYGFDGHPEQIRALHQLIYRRQDTLLVAKTSFGKSVVLQALPCLVPTVVVIVILPLNVIGAEQEQNISALKGAVPIHVHASNISAVLLEDIRTGRYTHVLISPELIMSERVRRVLVDPLFRSHVALVAIDEVHLVSDWGLTFRKAYTKLRAVRIRLGAVPWFACTATLDRATEQSVRRLLRFQAETVVIRTPVDRPDIALVRIYMTPAEKTSFTALKFVVERAYVETDVTAQIRARLTRGQSRRNILGTVHQRFPSPQRIHKTLVFLDSKSSLSACCETMRGWLEGFGYSRRLARATIQYYHASIADADKERIIRDIRKKSGNLRIVITSDALAHGANIKDIDRVVQFGLFRIKSVNLIWQRIGRCVRAMDRTDGVAFLLIERRWRGERGPILSRRMNSQPSQRKLIMERQLQNESAQYQNISAEDGITDFTADIASVASVDSAVLDELETNTAADVADAAEFDGDPAANSQIDDDIAVRITMDDVQRAQKVRYRTHAESRARLPETIYQLANESTKCLRNVFLSHYQERSEISGQNNCCSNCNPELIPSDIEDIQASSASRPRANKLLVADIRSWFDDWLSSHYAGFVWPPNCGSVISDAELRLLAHSASQIQDGVTIQRILPNWPWVLLGEAVDQLAQYIRVSYTRLQCEASSSQQPADIANRRLIRLSLSKSSADIPLSSVPSVAIFTEPATRDSTADNAPSYETLSPAVESTRRPLQLLDCNAVRRSARTKTPSAKLREQRVLN